MSFTFKATVIPGHGDWSDPLRSEAAIYIQRAGPSGIRDVLAQSANGWYWVPVTEGMQLDSAVGFKFPAEALEAVVDAIHRMQGEPSHAKTEAAVLREWLAVERGRVDKAMDR